MVKLISGAFKAYTFLNCLINSSLINTVMNFGLRSLSMMQRKQLFSITKIGWLNMLIVLKRSNAGVMGSNTAWDMLILPEFFFVVISKKSNEVWPAIQGVPPLF
jgi:hypothetical protein